VCGEVVHGGVDKPWTLNPESGVRDERGEVLHGGGDGHPALGSPEPSTLYQEFGTSAVKCFTEGNNTSPPRIF